ncbi:MAG: fibronectin type III domain-containing protein [Clostridiales bacterium]|nr:fibronectin type III domain-containing protein [Clostridiales bacterium]
MHLRWKSRLFVLLMAGVFCGGMTAYAVKTAGDWDAPAAVCAETTDAGDGAGSETPGEGGETVTQAMDLSSEEFTITLKEENHTYTGSAITPEIVVEGPVVKEDTGETGDTAGGNTGSGETAGSQTGGTDDGTAGGGTDDGTAGGGTDDGTAGDDQTPVQAERGTLQKDKDYTVTYENNTNAGTATILVKAAAGQNVYTGERKVTFTIKPKDISDLEMKGRNKVYKGRPLNSGVDMYYNGMKLERSKDYRMKDYSNNLNVGTASGTVVGKGNYTGERAMTFEITPKNIYELDFTPDLSKKTYIYTGQKMTPDVTFTFDILGEDNKVTGHMTLAKDVDYTISYVDNKKVGTAAVMILGRGNFNGSRIMTFKIRPQATKLKKLVKGKRSIKVKWAKKEKQVTGYMIMCSTKKDFSSNVKKVTVKKKTNKYTFKNLKKKKKYFVRVRTYKKSGGETYYSKWSNVMKIKTK